MNCPECGSELVDCVGYDELTDKTYDAVKCPNGCSLD